MGKQYYITTAIAYVNGEPHIGHAQEYILADVFARYRRLQKKDVYFLTGTDEYGLKNYQKAKAENLDAKAFVDRQARKFIDLQQNLSISYDRFIRTTDADHKRVCQWLWNKALKAGDLYEKEYEGLYCIGCEAFKMPDELENGKCPLHGKEPEKVKEKNWFFKLSKYAPEIAKRLKEKDLIIHPAHRTKETLNFLKKAEDISVSRSKERLSWGVEVPNDAGQVMYVWFDALTNYLTGARRNAAKESIAKEDFARWPVDLQVVGKDIFRFHTVIWQAMLISTGFDVSKNILIHGFINVNGQKMSKSTGNYIEAKEYIKKYGADALRYYILRYIPTTEDGDFSQIGFKQVYISDLGNDLGNLVQRTLSMIKSNKINVSGFLDHVPELPLWYTDKVEGFDFAGALGDIWKMVAEANTLINKDKPWELIKKDPQKAKATLGTVYKFIVDIAYLLRPFLPDSAHKIEEQLKTLSPQVIFPRI